MALFGSSSRTTQNSYSEVNDKRQVVDGGGIAVNADNGPVVITQVADEAFELAEFSVGRNAEFLETAQANNNDFLQRLLDEQDNLVGKSIAANSSFMSQVFNRQLDSERSEAAQLTSQFIKWAIPAVAVIYFLSRGIR